MEETVSSTDANRDFARLLRGVRAGRRYTILRHGQPIARLVPVAESGAGGARTALLDRLANEVPSEFDHWERDGLYGVTS